MSAYISVKTLAEYSEVIEKSRFTARCFPCASYAEAEERLAALRKEEYDATHHCYAGIFGSKGGERRCSDGGEPSGTAGVPILDAVSGAGLTNVFVVVTRWFGGVKLGTGGLSRAYRGVAAEAVARAGRTEYMLARELALSFDYGAYTGFQRMIRQFKSKVLSTVFADGVKVTVLVAEREVSAFRDALRELTLGRAKVSEGDADYRGLDAD